MMVVVIGCTLILSFGVVIFSNLYILNSFEKIEDQKMHDELAVIQKALNSYVSVLQSKATDWSAWDDAYRFVTDVNEEFIQANLSSTTIENLGIDAIYFFNKEQKQIAHSSLNKKISKELIQKYFSNHSNLLRFQPDKRNQSGLLKHGDAVFMFSTAAVVNSKMNQPARGSLLMIKQLNTNVLADLSQQVSRPLTLIKLNSKKFIFDEETWTSQPNVFVVPDVNEKFKSANVKFQDYFGRDIFLLNTKIERNIYENGKQSVYKIFLFLVITLTAFCLLLIKMLSAAVVRRITFMADEIAMIEMGYINRLSVFGKDEISKLSKKTNELLESNDRSNKELLNLNKLITKQYESLLNSAKLNALGTMATSVVHEVNDPLMIIQSRVKSIQRELYNPNNIDTAKVQSALNSISCAFSRVARLTQSLKKFSHDSKCDEFEHYDLSTLVNESISLCKDQLRLNKVEVRLANIEKVRIYCKPSEIVQIFINLINNSFEAIKDSEVKWIEIGTSYKNNLVQISITDSGQGIPVEIRNQIMLPFFTTKQVKPNQGLGLSITKHLVEVHNGRLTLDEESTNTKFIIELPMVS